MKPCLHRALGVAVASASLLVLDAMKAAYGDEPPPVDSVYVGLALGAHANLAGWDLYPIPDQKIEHHPGGLVLVRSGLQLSRWLALEGELGLLTLSATLANRQLNALATDLDGFALHGGIGALLTPFSAAWEPYLSAGLGAFHTISGSVGSDTDWDFHTGLGLRGAISPDLGLRAEARIVVTDGNQGGYDPVLFLTAGVDLIVWADTSSRDADRDGVPDEADECPVDAGVRTAALLKDGIGLGCPDVDRDGIVDRDDRCVMEPGLRRAKGCADRDGDGVVDIDDACREKPGLASHEGCPPPLPDGDEDGISDDVDGCPEERGSSLTEGCPDSDGDGVADLFDRCRSEVGVAREEGCLPKALARKFRGVMNGFEFNEKTNQLAPSAARMLDELARLLLPYETLRLVISVEVGGNRDAAAEKALAEAHAAVIRQGLTDRGVPGVRIVIELGRNGGRQVVFDYRGPVTP